jgi:hypothetical protein
MPDPIHAKSPAAVVTHHMFPSRSNFSLDFLPKTTGAFPPEILAPIAQARSPLPRCHVAMKEREQVGYEFISAS